MWDRACYRGRRADRPPEQRSAQAAGYYLKSLVLKSLNSPKRATNVSTTTWPASPFANGTVEAPAGPARSGRGRECKFIHVEPRNYNPWRMLGSPLRRAARQPRSGVALRATKSGRKTPMSRDVSASSLKGTDRWHEEARATIAPRCRLRRRFRMRSTAGGSNEGIPSFLRARGLKMAAGLSGRSMCPDKSVSAERPMSGRERTSSAMLSTPSFSIKRVR
jgi:hypothetical protein